MNFMHPSSGKFVSRLCIFFAQAATSPRRPLTLQLCEEQLVLFSLQRGVELHQVCSTHDSQTAHQSVRRMSTTSFTVLCHILGHSLTILLSLCLCGSVATDVFQPSATTSGS